MAWAALGGRVFDKLSDVARRALGRARTEAKELGHSCIGTEHILLGLAADDALTGKLLRDYDLAPDKIRVEVEKLAPRTARPATELLPFTAGAKAALMRAAEQAFLLRHHTIETAHLLLGVLDERDGAAVRALRNLGVAVGSLRQYLLDRYDGPPRWDPRRGPKKTPALDAFGRDLTARAREGRYDHLVERTPELCALTTILTSRARPNALVVGRPGAGRTSLVESLANRIARGEAHPELRDKRIVRLDLYLMYAGTKHRGQFEERWCACRVECRRIKDVILVLPDVHALSLGRVQPGDRVEGGEEATPGGEASLSRADDGRDPVLLPGYVTDLANLAQDLCHALRERDVQCVAPTTEDDHDGVLRHDAELMRFFQPLRLAEPADATCLEVLYANARRLYPEGWAKLDPRALEAAVTLGRRFLPDEALPESAVALLDQAIGRARQQVHGAGAGSSFDDVARACHAELRELRADVDDLEARKLAHVEALDWEKAAATRDARDQAAERADAARRRLEDHEEAAVARALDERLVAAVVAERAHLPRAEVERALPPRA